MIAVSSLKNRVFVASAFVAVLSIAVGTHFVTSRVSREAEAELRRDLQDAAALLGEHYESRSETLSLMAWLIADLPRLKAAVATGDGPTVLPLAREYRSRVGADVLVVTDGDGRILSSVGAEEGVVTEPALEAARAGTRSTYISDSDLGVLEMVTLPITIGPEPPEVLGTLSFGFFLNDALAKELQAVTQSEIVLLSSDRVVAATIPVVAADVVSPVPNEPFRLMVGGEEFVAVRRSLGREATDALVLRSRSDRLAFLRTFREGVLLSALIGVLLAIVLSYAVARTVAGPLGDITATIREMTATGDLAHKIELRGRLLDEDAIVLARAFNRLIEAIVRFQREAASRERLSALGRMSTVVAHEIRNPLMIIKASLRGLRRERLSDEEVREAADDIDHEVERLNHMVGDVLDFARPIRPDWQEADLNAICRDAVASALVGEAAPAIELRLDETLPLIVTDGERLRTALVNVLSNASDAVRTIKGRPAGEADIVLQTERAEGDKISVRIRDRGEGIPEESLPKIFEPYFTGKRTGTGLGLAITKNIVESLGGNVTARSGPSGTEIVVELYPKQLDVSSTSKEAVEAK